MTENPRPSGFDSYAGEYELALNRGLELTGESRDYFARRRAEIVRDCCQRLNLRVETVCDFGCGTGDTLPFLQAGLGATRLTGLDPSEATLTEARRRHSGCNFQFLTPSAFAGGAETCDVVYCNGVFHHIPALDRAAAAAYIMQILRPGGCWFFWENNPFNPGTRWVMSRIPFDHDAITLMPREARRLGRAANGSILGQTFHFYFPSSFTALRGLEKWLTRVPLGGQYLTVIRKAL